MRPAHPGAVAAPSPILDVVGVQGAGDAARGTMANVGAGAEGEHGAARPAAPSPPSPTASTAGALSRRSFYLSLAAISMSALAVRVVYVLAVTRHQHGPLYDSFWYYSTATELRWGEFFRAPFSLVPTAAHPPMTAMLLGVASYVVGTGVTSLLLVMAVLGTGVVVCVGLLGRTVAGPWVGLVAAGLAAIAPNFWMPSGILMPETPAMLFMALILMAVVRVTRRPTVGGAVLLGLACGIEVLVRAELILFVPGLLIPAVLLARGISGQRRVLLIVVGLLATTLVLAPWVGRNLATFRDATYISTADGGTLLGSNCPQTYSGPDIGLWSLTCASKVGGKGDESVRSARKLHAAVQFIEHHLGRLPVVVLARVARQWELYQPAQMAQLEVHEGRPYGASLAGLGFYYALLPFAAAGIVLLRRRGIAQWFLLVPAGVVTIVAALFCALIRYEAPFEVCLVILAAAGMVMLARRIRSAPPTARGDGPVAGTPEPTPLATADR